MKKYAIPHKNRDLKSYTIRRNIKYPLLFLSYVGILSFAFFYYLNRRYEDAEALDLWVYLLFFGIVLVSGWMIFYMNRFFFEKTVCGRIGSASYLRNYGRGLSRRGGFSLDEHTYLKILITDEKGRHRSVKFPLFEDGYDGYYREGMTLLKFRGLNYPLCLESEAEGAHICTVCGVRTYYQEGKVIYGEAEPEMRDGQLICRSCKHTLIDIKQLKEG